MVLVVSFAEAGRLTRYQDLHRWPFQLAADPDRTLYHELGVGRLGWNRLFEPRALVTYWQLWRRGGKAFPFEPDDVQQGGGDFLVDPAGQVLFAHISRDPTDRPSASSLQRAVDEALAKLAAP